jgi:hypothetical protein
LSLVRGCAPIPQKIYKTTKRLRTQEEVERYFPGFISFTDCTKQQIPRPENRRRKKTYYSGKRKRHTIKTHLMVNNCGVIIHKTKHKRGHRHDYNIYKKNHPVTPKDAVNVFDLGHLGGGRDFPTKHHICQTKIRGTIISCLKRKKITTRTTPEKG